MPIGIPFERKAFSNSSEFLKIMEIRLDSRTIYLSTRDIFLNNTPYEGSVISFGDIRNSREIEAGLEQTKNIEVVLNNAISRFQDNLEFEEILNREIIIREIEITVDETLIKFGNHIDLLFAVIDDYSWDSNTFNLTLADISRKIYLKLPKYIIQNSEFSGAVDVGKPYPVIFGLVVKVPIYSINGDGLVYMGCMIPSGHTVRSDKDDGTFKIYLLKKLSTNTDPQWSEINSSNYTIDKTTTDSNDIVYYKITFVSDQSGSTLSMDFEGIEDDASGTFTGTATSLITNFADACRFVFQNTDLLGRGSTEINIGSFQRARTDLDRNYTNSPTLAWWIGEQKNAELLIEELSLAMRRSYPAIGLFGGKTEGVIETADDFTTRGLGGSDKAISRSLRGKSGAELNDLSRLISLNIIETVNNKAAVLECNTENIIGDIKIKRRTPSELQNKILLKAGYNHSENKFVISSESSSSTSISKYLTTRIGNYKCYTLSNQLEIDELVTDLITMEKDLPFIVNFELNKEHLILNREDVILITSENGPGMSKVKYGDGHFYGEIGLKYGQRVATGWNRQKAEIISIEKLENTALIEAKIL